MCSCYLRLHDLIFVVYGSFWLAFYSLFIVHVSKRLSITPKYHCNLIYLTKTFVIKLVSFAALAIVADFMFLLLPIQYYAFLYYSATYTALTYLLPPSHIHVLNHLPDLQGSMHPHSFSHPSSRQSVSPSTHPPPLVLAQHTLYSTPAMSTVWG